MVGSQDTGVAGAHAIGVTLALSNGVPEGIAAIQQDLVSLDRTMAAGGVGLDVLIQLAEEVHTLGSQGVVPTAARNGPALPESSPTVNSRPGLMSAEVSDAAYSQPVREGLRTQISATADVASQSPRSAAGLEKVNLAPAISLTPSLATDRTNTPSEHWPTAPATPAAGESVVQVAPTPLRNAAANNSAAAPVDPLPAMSAPVTATLLSAVQNTAFASAVLAPTTAAPAAIASTAVAPMTGTPIIGTPITGTPMTVAPSAAPTQDLPGVHSTMAYEMMIAAARSQATLVTGPSAPSNAQPTPQAAPISPLDVQRSGVPGNQGTPADLQRSSPMSRQSPETAAEPRQGLLILDGSQLGRWIMDRIARQVSRPVAGTTGIDPRISPTFPGAPASV